MKSRSQQGQKFEYASINQLSAFNTCFALPFVAWSAYPLITHALLRSLLPKLARFNPNVFLLDEDEEEVRVQLHKWFPDRFGLDVPGGAGSLIWMISGKPMHCIAGPNLTETEILAVSQKLWSASDI